MFSVSDLKVKDDMVKCYPHAKLGHLKTGGNFPFLSRSDEFNLFVAVSTTDDFKFFFLSMAGRSLYKDA
jgi:maspardin